MTDLAPTAADIELARKTLRRHKPKRRGGCAGCGTVAGDPVCIKWATAKGVLRLAEIVAATDS